jgi:thiol-disulfide isomerase/thioredoxin
MEIPMTRTRLAFGLLSALVILTLGSVQADDPKAAQGQSKDDAAKTPAEVTLKTVKYQQLGEAVKAAKGNVVVVDVWATYCAPCKREFPSFVKLHNDKAKDGVVCIAVSVDEKENREFALTYLKKQNATTANYWLDEPGEVWQANWKVKAVPVVFVFDRKGKLAKKFDNDTPDPKKPNGFTYEEVNKVVDELLKPDF